MASKTKLDPGTLPIVGSMSKFIYLCVIFFFKWYQTSVVCGVGSAHIGPSSTILVRGWNRELLDPVK